jgi:pSer/pThr/pTyr-binding forkhead associated (FHA) protein
MSSAAAGSSFEKGSLFEAGGGAVSPPPVMIRIKDSEIRFTQTFTIGRSPDSDLQMADIRVSRNHAVVEFDGANWVIRDLGSANGTYVDGARIERLRLPDKSEVQLARGGPIFSLFIERGKQPR